MHHACLGSSERTTVADVGPVEARYQPRVALAQVQLLRYVVLDLRSTAVRVKFR